MSGDRPRVFGVGMNKTGTTTLGECLRRLGYRHASFDAALLDRWAAGDVEALIERARTLEAVEDWPWPLAFRELDRSFPGSRFVLTVRRSPDVWLESLLKHAERTGPTRARELVFGHAMPAGHEDEHRRVYEAHNAAVRAWFADRPDDLLEVCWETGDGWAELCGFLGHPVPDGPLPHANRRPPGPLGRVLRRAPRLEATIRSLAGRGRRPR